MSEETQQASGQHGTESSGSSVSQSIDSTSGESTNSVQYETYRKTLGEAKKAKSLLEQEREQRMHLEQELLAREGKKDELIDALKKQNGELNTKLTSAVGSFARSQVQKEVLFSAKELGCTSDKLLLKAIEDEISGLDYDESFNPDKEQIKMLLNKIKQEEPILFQKAGPKLGSHFPKGQNFDPQKPNLGKLKKEQLMDLLYS